jgi:hypothetical protein
MPLVGCQIGSSAATKRVDGPSMMAGSIGLAPPDVHHPASLIAGP